MVWAVIHLGVCSGREDVPGGRKDVQGEREDVPGGQKNVQGEWEDIQGEREDVQGLLDRIKNEELTYKRLATNKENDGEGSKLKREEIDQLIIDESALDASIKVLESDLSKSNQNKIFVFDLFFLDIYEEKITRKKWNRQHNRNDENNRTDQT